jgi:hypothetical protein
VGVALYEDVIAVDGTTAATSGTPIDASLARSISARRREPQVRLTAASDPATLTCLTLDEDIDDTSAGARRGSHIDAELAQRLSAALRGATLKVLAAPADMAGRAGLTLRESVYSATIVAARDTLIDEQHASAIAHARPGGKVCVRPAAAPGQAAPATTVAADATALVGQVLDEDVLRIDLVAPSGAAVDEALAQQIAAAIVGGPVRVLRQIAADPARLAAMEEGRPSPTLGEDIVDTTVAIRRGALLDPSAARSASALRLPRDTWVRVQVDPGAVSLAYAVLQEPIVDSGGVLVASTGAMISPQLAERISTLSGATPAAIHVLVPPAAEWLDGAILDETIVDADGSMLASSGAQPDRDLAERISALRLAVLPEAAPASAADYAAQGLVWVRPPHPDAPDDGGALIRIFGRMMEGSIARLNKALDKQRLAFLNMIGADVLPPQPARAALTFQLAPRSTGAFVPAGTRVLAQAGADQVGFETDQDLNLTDAQLVAVLLDDPIADQVGDYTAVATGMADGSFPAFVGNAPAEHSLYLSNDNLLALPGVKDVRITFIAPSGAPDLTYTSWSYWDGTRWKQVDPGGLSMSMPSGTQTDVSITGIAALAPLTIAGYTGGWLRAQPLVGHDLSNVIVHSIYISVTITADEVVSARAFANAAPVDLTKDFYPFGEQPHFNDTFYLSLPDGLASQGAEVTLDVKLTNPADSPNNPPDSANLPIPAVKANGAQVTWEVWLGDRWTQVAVGAAPQIGSSGQPPIVILSLTGIDETLAFTRSQKISFVMPAAPARLTLGGASG